MVVGVKVRDVPSAADPARGCYLVAIPRSAQAPYAVRHENPQPLFSATAYATAPRSVSHGSRACPRYRDRFALSRDQVDRLARVHAEGRSGENPAAAALAVAVILPSPATGP